MSIRSLAQTNTGQFLRSEKVRSKLQVHEVFRQVKVYVDDSALKHRR